MKGPVAGPEDAKEEIMQSIKLAFASAVVPDQCSPTFWMLLFIIAIDDDRKRRKVGPVDAAEKRPWPRLSLRAKDLGIDRGRSI